MKTQSFGIQEILIPRKGNGIQIAMHPQYSSRLVTLGAIAFGSV